MYILLSIKSVYYKDLVRSFELRWDLSLSVSTLSINESCHLLLLNGGVLVVLSLLHDDFKGAEVFVFEVDTRLGHISVYA